MNTQVSKVCERGQGGEEGGKGLKLATWGQRIFGKMDELGVTRSHSRGSGDETPQVGRQTEQKTGGGGVQGRAGPGGLEVGRR